METSSSARLQSPTNSEFATFQVLANQEFVNLKKGLNAMMEDDDEFSQSESNLSSLTEKSKKREE